jgi:hypothetical protein
MKIVCLGIGVAGIALLLSTIRPTAAAEKGSTKEKGKAEKVEPVLPPDAAALKIIESLGENQCAELPPTKMVGEWNELTRKFRMEKLGPGFRGYSNKLIWAPERKRALYCGADHNNPHRLNDVWEFDLTANTWILLYPPDINNRAHLLTKEILIKTTEVRNGVHVTKKGGGPVELAHQWWTVTYEPELKAMVWLCGSFTPRFRKKWRVLPGADESKMFAGPPLWQYIPGERRWKFQRTPKPHPRLKEAALLEYIPGLGGCLYYRNLHSNTETWLLSSKTWTWKNLNSKKARLMPSPEQVGCWDSVNKVLVVHSGAGEKRLPRTCHYDPRTNAWTTTQEAKKLGDLPRGHDNFTTMYFDPVGEVCLLLDHPSRRSGLLELWAYETAKQKWTKLSPEGKWPAEKRKGRQMLAMFDPHHNVFVLNAGPKTWVYRYKKAGRKEVTK